MTRDLERLSQQAFDLLVLGGGVHGLAAAYDAAQRGLSVALVERDDFGSAASFNHLKTVHGGLRYLQTADLTRMRESIVERRTLARIAPHLLTPLPFLMPTYRKLTRSQLAMRVGFLVDGMIGYDRNAGVPPRLQIPTGRLITRDECLKIFPDVRQRGLTGGALWFDYQVRHAERLMLSFALAADASGACLANHVEALSVIRDGARVRGALVRDVLTGSEFEVRAEVTLNAAGAGAGRLAAGIAAGAPQPLLKAMNLVTSRPMAGPALASATDDGRMLFVVPWEGRLLAGTSHSPTTCGPDDSEVTTEEMLWFIGQVNEAFPALKLGPEDVTMVHRGVVPALQHRGGEVDLEGHVRIRDHAADGVQGMVSLRGVKFTTGRHVGASAVNVVMRKLGRRGETRTHEVPLPGATEDLEAVVADIRRRAPGLDPGVATALARTCGTQANRVLDVAAADPALGQPVSAGAAVIAAQVVYAVREESACTLADVIARRTPLGAAGAPPPEAVEACAALMARECRWDPARTSAEIAALARFYEPVGFALPTSRRTP